MTPQELEKWSNAQIHAAVARGVNPIDAANAVKRFLAKLPQGADPNTYVPNDNLLSMDLVSGTVLDDVRSAWYGDEKVPAKYKRLLDAKAVE